MSWPHLAVGALRSLGGAFLFLLYVLFGERSLAPFVPPCGPAPGHDVSVALFVPQ